MIYLKSLNEQVLRKDKDIVEKSIKHLDSLVKNQVIWIENELPTVLLSYTFSKYVSSQSIFKELNLN